MMKSRDILAGIVILMAVNTMAGLARAEEYEWRDPMAVAVNYNARGVVTQTAVRLETARPEVSQPSPESLAFHDDIIKDTTFNEPRQFKVSSR
jgi:hypothetical protein